MDERSTETRTEADRRWAALMASAQAGDQGAYETLLRECVPQIKRVVQRAGLRGDLVDDAVQETLLTLHRARQTYDPKRSFTAWLSVISERRAIDLMRRAGRSGRREVHAPFDYDSHPDDSAAPDQGLERAAQAGRLGVAIASLPPIQREAVEHLALREQSLAEAALSTGRTSGALKVNLHRALKSLRVRLGAREGGRDE